MKTLFHRGLAALAFAAMGAVAVSGASAKEVFVYNWSNYIPPELLKRFESETGIKVTLDSFASNEALFGKLQAGASGYDVIVPSDYLIPRLAAEGLIQKIDGPSLSNFENVKTAFRNPGWDEGRQWSLPYMWGTTGIAYDSAVAGELDQTWKEFFEPRDELKGKLVALNDMNEVISAATFYLGVPRCTEDPQHAQQILELLEKQKPDLAMYQSEGTIDRMTAGEVVMHHMWNGAAHRTKMNRPTVEYIYPKEGLVFWADNMAIPKDAKNVEEARTFINWMLDPRNAAEVSNFTGYMNAIAGSEEFLKPEMANDPAVNMPDEYGDRLRAAEVCSKKALDLRDKIWTKLKS